MSNLVLRDGGSLELLRERVLAEFGHNARIIAEERITTGGIGGFFARQLFRVTVELPDPTGLSAHNMDLPTRVGLAALLAEADSAEQLLLERPPAVVDRPSTSSPSFAALLEQMTATTIAPPAAERRSGTLHAFPTFAPLTPGDDAPGRAAPTPPSVLKQPGDLVLCIGLGDDAHAVAQRWSDALGAERAELGASPFAAPVTALHAAPGAVLLAGRRDAASSRARGVERNTAVFVGATLDGVHSATAPAGRQRREEQLGAAASLFPDQTWLVVDASRKAEDTEEWVLASRNALEVHGIVAIGRDETATPRSVELLGLPVLWEPKG